MTTTRSADTAARLAKEFDESFGRPIATDREKREDLLAIRAGDAHLAVRALETAGITRCPPLAFMPSGNAAFRGLAGVRGTLAAVFDIGALTLVGERHPSAPTGWIVLCVTDKTVALLFDELVGYESVASSAIHTAESPEPGAPTRQVVELGGVNRAVVSIAELLETIRRTAPGGTSKER